MNTIGESWADFETKAVPPTAQDGQRRDMKTCFYAGALSMFALFEEQTRNNPNLVNFEEFMICLRAEVVEYFETREKNYAE